MQICLLVRFMSVGARTYSVATIYTHHNIYCNDERTISTTTSRPLSLLTFGFERAQSLCLGI